MYILYHINLDYGMLLKENTLLFKEIVFLSTVNIFHKEVNCDTASKIGITCMKEIVVLSFEHIRVHLRRMNEVSNLLPLTVTCNWVTRKSQLTRLLRSREFVLSSYLMNT